MDIKNCMDNLFIIESVANCLLFIKKISKKRNKIKNLAPAGILKTGTGFLSPIRANLNSNFVEQYIHKAVKN